MATIDQQFVEYIVKTLVNNPDKVEVSRKIDEKGVLLSLSVDPEDVGRVIGKRGATAQSLRTLLRALGTKNDARYNLKIVNTDSDDAPTSDPSEEEPAESAPSETLAEDTRKEMEDLDDLDI
ncbi:KH domain-containing protein [Candidatus Saccharibacteria bacterium]|nr:KH domain-containing protein [Candidatus Saccharibacteria bacterium]